MKDKRRNLPSRSVRTLMAAGASSLLAFLLIYYKRIIVAEGKLKTDERYLSLLNDLTRASLATSNSKAFLQILASHLHELFGADSCYITLWDEKEKLVTPVAAFKPLDQAHQYFRARDGEQTLTKSVLDAGRALAIGDTSNTPYVSKRIADFISARSILALPLMANGQKLGAAIIGYYRRHYFTKQELVRGNYVALQVALAVSKAQAFELAHRRMQESETLRATMASLNSLLDLEQVISNILVHLEDLAPYDSACLFLLEEGNLIAVAERGFPVPDQVLGKRFPTDNVLLKESVKMRVPMVLEDAQQDSRFQHWGDTWYVRGWMGVPLISQGKLIGYLTLDNKHLGAYGPDQARLAQIFADQAAIAIEKARLYNRERQRVRQLDALHTATKVLLSTLNLEELLKQIISAAISAIPSAQKGALILVDRETGNLQVRATEGYLDRRVAEIAFPITQGYSAEAVRTCRPLVIEDARADPAICYNGDIQEMREILSAIVVPLVLEDEAIGTLSLDSSHRSAFTAEDLELLSSFAATATAAIRNAELHADVQRMAITDALTGLYNLRGLSELGRREVERSRRFERPLSCILLDIDHFKIVNDTHGHRVGNQVLSALAQLCKENVRDIDIVARFGGEEFVVLTPEADLNTALGIAERLRELVAAAPMQTEAGNLNITISLGVAVADAQTNELTSLIERADAAMYMAKQAGRNQVAS